MREILFRGKISKKSDGFFYGHYYEDQERRVHYIAENEKGKLHHYIVDPETVGQYTGLKDCNGKMIFEGDIVRIITQLDEKDSGEVYFDHGAWQVENHDSYNDGYGSLFHEDEIAHTIEIIGNVHDNPELMEAQHG
jgi:uncharacterized phage protein (TIGR01671 family)